MKDKVIYVLSILVGTAIIAAIVGDYVTAAIETQVTGEAVEVSAEVMTLVQTALGGLIGIIGGYFGAKANKKDEDQQSRQYHLMPILGAQSAGTKATPSAPTIGAATAGNASASVTFTAPSFSKLPITSYTVTSSPGSITGTGASSPVTVSGLSNGTAYTFTVTASTASSTTPASSASNSVTPVAPIVGTTWTLGTLPLSTSGNLKVKGVGPYVALFSSGTTSYYVTTNGSTWTTKTFPVNGLVHLEYYNGVYVGIDGNASWTSNVLTYYTSTDLTNWTSRTHNNGGDGYSFGKLWTDGSSIMISAKHPSNIQWAIYRTTDGINWTNYTTASINNANTGGSNNRVGDYGDPGYLNGYYYFLGSNGGTPSGTMRATSLSGPWTWVAINAPYYDYGRYMHRNDFSIALSQGNGGSSGQYRTWTTPGSYTYTSSGTGGWGTNVYTNFGNGEANPTNAFIIALREMAGGGGAYYRSTTGLANSWTVYTNTYFDGSAYYDGGNYNAGSMQANNWLWGRAIYGTSTLSGVMVAAPVGTGTKSLYSIS